MKRYFEEIVILIIQLLVFFIFPLFGVNDTKMGIIVIILLSTFMLSLVFGGISKERIKYYYPVIMAIVFIPVVYIFKTEFILFHTVWILAASFLGVVIGDFIMNK